MVDKSYAQRTTAPLRLWRTGEGRSTPHSLWLVIDCPALRGLGVKSLASYEVTDGTGAGEVMPGRSNASLDVSL
jgi:hypothetical protein